jgi:hypothetical protein
MPRENISADEYPTNFWQSFTFFARLNNDCHISLSKYEARKKPPNTDNSESIADLSAICSSNSFRVNKMPRNAATATSPRKG